MQHTTQHAWKQQRNLPGSSSGVRLTANATPRSEDPETCQSWLRMRNRDGRYTLMFEEWVTEGPFIISPRITFEVCGCVFVCVCVCVGRRDVRVSEVCIDPGWCCSRVWLGGGVSRLDGTTAGLPDHVSLFTAAPAPPSPKRLPPLPTPNAPSPPHTPPPPRRQVSVRVLGGLMALGYEIGTIMRRRSVIFRSADDELTVKLDEIENLGDFVQVAARGLRVRGVSLS